MQSTLICVLFAFCIHASLGQDAKYCDKSLCTDWTGQVKKHIACPGNAPVECPSGAKEIVMTPELKNVILDFHNSKRNDLAGGKIPGFPTARRMPTLQWDEELASFARANAKRCTYGHDECRNSQTFKWAGQNIAYTTNYASDLDHITNRLNAWWDEYKECDVKYVTKFGNSGKMIGHFTAIAQDHANRIGCAAQVFPVDMGLKRLIVCNYSYTNIQDTPVYVAGPTCSNCKTGKHSKYPNLCSENEVIDPNPTF
jgi:hypothetical protein